jgi:predicted Zn-dependent peptidase
MCAGLLGALLCCLGIVAPVQAQEELPIPIERYQLDNGLRVVLSADPSTPVVSVAVYYDVGSRNETRGRSGFAHLFEHMMFQGSASVGKMEHFQLINAVGGSANGTTSPDRTNYYQTLPSHQLGLALWLEADRMKSLAVTAQNFENQRSVVINEYRQSYENAPYGLSFLRINELAYGDYFPYANPTIGTVTDLNQATWEDARAFWQQWYGPNNAVLAIVGDIDPTEARQLVEQHFGSIARRDVPNWEDPGFGGQSEEQQETRADRLATLPLFFQVYHIPPSRHADHYPLELLAVIVGDGESSRLHRVLVEERQVCMQVRAYTDDRRGPDLINVEGVVAAGHRPEEARALTNQVIEQLVREGVTERELAKARNRARAYFVFGLQTTLQRAKHLAEFELYFGDASLLRGELNRYLQVTAEEVQQVAARYLVANNRTVLDTLPAAMMEQAAEGTSGPAPSNQPEATEEETAQ